MSALDLIRDEIALVEAETGSSRIINRIVLSASVYNDAQIEMDAIRRVDTISGFTHLWGIPVFGDPTLPAGTFRVIRDDDLVWHGPTGRRSYTRP